MILLLRSFPRRNYREDRRATNTGGDIELREPSFIAPVQCGINRDEIKGAIEPRSVERVKLANDGKVFMPSLVEHLRHLVEHACRWDGGWWVPVSSVFTVGTLRCRPRCKRGFHKRTRSGRKEGRCRKILQLQKFRRKEGERKKFRGSLSAENARGGGECEERTACQLFGGGEGTEGRVEAAATAIFSNLRFAATTMI